MMDYWGFLGKIDVVFGVLGGFVMVWEVLSQLRKRIGESGKKSPKTDSTPKKMVTNSDKVRNFLLDAMSKASEPISYTLIGTIILILIGMISAEKISYLSVTVTMFSATFTGLLVGTIVDTLAKTSGAPIRSGVWVAVIIGFAVAAMQTFSGSVLLPSAVGGVIGSLWGLVREKDGQYKTLQPDGTWDTAKDIALITFKKRIDKYSWMLEKISIDSFSYDRGKGFLTVSIVIRKAAGSFAEPKWWPIERYSLTIIRSGEIIEMKPVPILEHEKYKNPLEDYLGTLSGQNHRLSENVALIEVKKPIISSADKGVRIRIEFIVENYGPERKVYPQVEFTVAQLRHGKFENKLIRSPSSWVVLLEPFSRTPIAFETVVDPTTQVLTDALHPVQVRLSPSPAI